MRVESDKPSTNRLGGWLHRVADPRPALVLPTVKPQQESVRDWGVVAKRMYAAGANERVRLAEQLGLRTSALEELMVGLGFDEHTGLSFSSWPERDASGKVVGIVRRYGNGAKKTVRGSHHGLYYGREPFAMPGPVLLVEGGSDTAALVGMGVNVVGRPSNTGGIAELAKLLKGVAKPLVVIGERDKKQPDDCDCGACMKCWPGLAGARMTAERLGAALGRHVAIKMFPRAKDAREWVKTQENATAVDVLHDLYDPVKDHCRVCGNGPPHLERRVLKRIEVVCRECRTLLENKKL